MAKLHRLERERQQAAGKQQTAAEDVSMVEDVSTQLSQKASGSKKRKRAEGVESKNQELVDSETAKAREVSFKSIAFVALG